MSLFSLASRASRIDLSTMATMNAIATVLLSGIAHNVRALAISSAREIKR